MSNLFGLVKLHGSIMGLLVCDDQVVTYKFYDISYWYEMAYHFLEEFLNTQEFVVYITEGFIICLIYNIFIIICSVNFFHCDNLIK